MTEESNLITEIEALPYSDMDVEEVIQEEESEMIEEAPILELKESEPVLEII